MPPRRVWVPVSPTAHGLADYLPGWSARLRASLLPARHRRVVRPGLHCEVDSALGHAVELSISASLALQGLDRRSHASWRDSICGCGYQTSRPSHLCGAGFALAAGAMHAGVWRMVRASRASPAGTVEGADLERDVVVRRSFAPRMCRAAVLVPRLVPRAPSSLGRDQPQMPKARFRSGPSRSRGGEI